MLNRAEFSQLQSTLLSHLARTLYIFYIQPQARVKEVILDPIELTKQLISISTFAPCNPTLSDIDHALNELEQLNLIKRASDASSWQNAPITLPLFAQEINYIPGRAFQMYPSWLPSATYRSVALQAGLVDYDYQEQELQQFISFWLTRTVTRNQQGWERSFALRLLKVRSSQTVSAYDHQYKASSNSLANFKDSLITEPHQSTACGPNISYDQNLAPANSQAPSNNAIFGQSQGQFTSSYYSHSQGQGTYYGQSTAQGAEQGSAQGPYYAQGLVQGEAMASLGSELLQGQNGAKGSAIGIDISKGFNVESKPKANQYDLDYYSNTIPSNILNSDYEQVAPNLPNPFKDYVPATKPNNNQAPIFDTYIPYSTNTYQAQNTLPERKNYQAQFGKKLTESQKRDLERREMEYQEQRNKTDYSARSRRVQEQVLSILGDKPSASYVQNSALAAPVDKSSLIANNQNNTHLSSHSSQSTKEPSQSTASNEAISAFEPSTASSPTQLTSFADGQMASPSDGHMVRLSDGQEVEEVDAFDNVHGLSLGSAMDQGQESVLGTSQEHSLVNDMHKAKAACSECGQDAEPSLALNSTDNKEQLVVGQASKIEGSIEQVQGNESDKEHIKSSLNSYESHLDTKQSTKQNLVSTTNKAQKTELELDKGSSLFKGFGQENELEAVLGSKDSVLAIDHTAQEHLATKEPDAEHEDRESTYEQSSLSKLNENELLATNDLISSKELAKQTNEPVLEQALLDQALTNKAIANDKQQQDKLSIKSLAHTFDTLGSQASIEPELDRSQGLISKADVVSATQIANSNDFALSGVNMEELYARHESVYTKHKDPKRRVNKPTLFAMATGKNDFESIAPGYTDPREQELRRSLATGQDQALFTGYKPITAAQGYTPSSSQEQYQASQNIELSSLAPAMTNNSSYQENTTANQDSPNKAKQEPIEKRHEMTFEEAGLLTTAEDMERAFFGSNANLANVSSNSSFGHSNNLPLPDCSNLNETNSNDPLLFGSGNNELLSPSEMRNYNELLGFPYDTDDSDLIIKEDDYEDEDEDELAFNKRASQGLDKSFLDELAREFKQDKPM